MSTEWERIRDLERNLAEKELDRNPVPEPSATTRTGVPESVPSAVSSTTGDPKVYARQLLGVQEGCSFEDLRKAFTRLNKRSDPANFPSGSPEANKAADIQRRVNWAYNLLTEGMDATERRFRTLELE